MKIRFQKNRIYFWSLALSLCSGIACASDSGIDLEKIVVTPSRYEQEYKTSAANISVVDEEEIAESGAAEVTQVLETLPSLNVIDYGSYGSTKTAHVRGTGASNSIVLINGRPVNTPRDGVADFNQIPLNNIERIEYLRGPSSSIYGANATGGVINIITKSGKEKMLTELDTGIGSFLTYEADLAHGWKVGRFDYFATADYIESDGFRENSDYLQHNYTLKLGLDANKDNRLAFETGYSSSEGGVPGRITDPDLDDRQEQKQDYFSLTWNGSCWEDSRVMVKLYQNLDRIEFIESLSPVHDKDTNQTKVFGADLQISQVWFDVFRTSFGASGQDNRLDSSTSGKHSYELKAAYIETELELFNKALSLKAGARTDDYSNFGSRTSPSASFSWWFFDKIKAHGLVARSFRAPTFNDLYWPREDWGMWGGVEGNPNLKPEIARSREIGAGTFLFDKIEVDATYFYTKFKDMISWTMDETYWWRPSNINTAATKGVEAYLNYQMTRAMKLNLNYTRLSAMDEVTKKWLIYRPRHEYKGTLYYTDDRFNCYLTGRYLTKRYTVDDNSRFLKSYFVADASISYNLTKFGAIYLTVYNILDRDYQEEEGYPMPGTSFMTGIKLKF
jgi:outer membrane receptor for ferrienterochelin and colicins